MAPRGSMSRASPLCQRQCGGVPYEAVTAAKQAGAKISVDLNFRKKLWTEAAAQQVMRPIMANVDVVIANEKTSRPCSASLWPTPTWWAAISTSARTGR